VIFSNAPLKFSNGRLQKFLNFDGLSFYFDTNRKRLRSATGAWTFSLIWIWRLARERDLPSTGGNSLSWLFATEQESPAVEKIKQWERSKVLQREVGKHKTGYLNLSGPL
jgi:hypothetical protein